MYVFSSCPFFSPCFPCFSPCCCIHPFFPMFFSPFCTPWPHSPTAHGRGAGPWPQRCRGDARHGGGRRRCRATPSFRLRHGMHWGLRVLRRQGDGKDGAVMETLSWLVVSNIIFHNVWDNHDNPSHWLVFFKMVKTTNQYQYLRDILGISFMISWWYSILGIC